MENAPKQAALLTWGMILSMVTWGISWPVNHVLSQFGGPVVLGVWRYGFVIISLFIVLLLLRNKITIAKKGILFVLISGVLMAFYNYTFLQGLKEGNAGAGGILVTTLNPIVAYLIGMLVDWRKPQRNEWIGLSLGLIAGLVLLRVWDGSSALFDGGNILFFTSAVTWAIMSKFTSKAAQFGSPFAFTWWMYIVTLLILLPFNDWSSFGQLLHETRWSFWGNLLFGSIITTTFATTLYFYATSKIGAEKASSFIFIVPLCAALSAWIFIGESIEIHSIIGGILGIAAVYFIQTKRFGGR